ncbi:MAG: hypothetical protein ACE5FF_13025 [Saprospiraceae bacterium]
MKIKTTFLSLILLSSVALLLAFSNRIKKDGTPSPVTVGALVDGAPVLTLTDAQLTSALGDYLQSGVSLRDASIASDTTIIDGQFYVLLANSLQSGVTSQVAFDLRVSGTGLRVTSGSCQHKCTPEYPCTGSCRLKIIKKCVEIDCTCKQSVGGCASSITTYD